MNQLLGHLATCAISIVLSVTACLSLMRNVPVRLDGHEERIIVLDRRAEKIDIEIDKLKQAGLIQEQFNDNSLALDKSFDKRIDLLYSIHKAEQETK